MLTMLKWSPDWEVRVEMPTWPASTAVKDAAEKLRERKPVAMPPQAFEGLCEKCHE